MKFSSIALFLASALLADPSSAEGEACLDLDSLVFPSCGGQVIVNTIATELEALGDACTHSEREEIKLLAGSSKFAFAKKILRARCRAGAAIPVPCTDWSGVELDGCTLESVKDEVAAKLAALPTGDCTHDAAQELKILTGSKNDNQARKYIKAICGTAWLDVEQSKYRLDVDNYLRRNIMNQYTEGGTALNLETGNFQGDDNPAFPTPAGSLARTMGASIAAFQAEGNTDSVLQKVPTLNGCENQAMMCCFGRDRQSNDDNGNCNDNDCDNADPADNSNLCKIGTVPFPGEEEGDIHCHGIAWASDTNDFTAQLKYNNWWYVSMFDHMYQRGYVEHLLAGNQAAIDKVGVDFLPPMCGCMEDMPVVSRSDCTQIDATQKFVVNLDDDMLLYAEPQGDLQVAFNQCQGINSSNGQAANNDLASYVYRLNQEGKLDDATLDYIRTHLVGYDSPNDNENEAACTAAL